MELELDKRIRSLSDIFNSSDTQIAKEFLEQKGYFTNNIYFFKNIQLWQSGTLVNVLTDKDVYTVFRRKEDGAYYEYFIPESLLKSKEERYRPFTNSEEFFLMKDFEVGTLIHIRSKANNKEYHLMITGYTDEELMLGNFHILPFNELLQDFELWDCENGKFMPFGVEE